MGVSLGQVDQVGHTQGVLGVEEEIETRDLRIAGEILGLRRKLLGPPC